MYTIKLLTYKQLTKQNLYAMLRLRNEVFIVEQNCAYQDLDNNDQQATHVLISNAANELVATCRLFNKGSIYSNYACIGRVCCASNTRNTGLGKLLMQTALLHITTAMQEPVVKISAQYYLLQFYTALGFVAEGKMYLEDNIDHIAMVYNV
jgi:ElaA protein